MNLKQQFPSSDSVRRPIRFRSPSDWIPSAVRHTSYTFTSISHNTYTLIPKPSQHTSITSTPSFQAFNPRNPSVFIDLSQIEPKNATFLKLFRQNTCTVLFFVIPLHPLSRTNLISQMSRTKLASVMPWRKFVSNEIIELTTR